MKKLLFSIFAVTLLLTSCGGADPVKFNDTIVNEQMKLATYATEYGTKLGVAIATNSYADMKVTTDSLNTRIDRSISVIKDLKTPSNGEKFKEAAITYFESMKKIGTIGISSDSVDVEKVMADFQSIEAEVTKHENAFLEAQKEFAKDKNMQLK